jgi:hypothetical protein
MGVTTVGQPEDRVFGENAVSGAQHVSRESLLNGRAERSFNRCLAGQPERISI